MHTYTFVCHMVHSFTCAEKKKMHLSNFRTEREGRGFLGKNTANRGKRMLLTLWACQSCPTLRVSVGEPSCLNQFGEALLSLASQDESPEALAARQRKQRILAALLAAQILLPRQGVTAHFMVQNSRDTLQLEMLDHVQIRTT